MKLTRLIIVTALVFATAGCEKGKEGETPDCCSNEVKEIPIQKFSYKKITTQDIGKIHNLALMKVRAEISSCNKDGIKEPNLEKIYDLLYSTVNMFIDGNVKVIKFSQIDKSLIELERKGYLDINDVMLLYKKMVDQFLSKKLLSSNLIRQFDDIVLKIVWSEDDIKTIKENINKFSKIKTTNKYDELFLQMFVNVYAYSYSFWTSNYSDNIGFKPKASDGFGLVAFADAIGGAVGGGMGSYVAGQWGAIAGGASGAVGLSALAWQESSACCKPSCRCGCRSSSTGNDNGLPEELLSEFYRSHVPITIFD